MSREIDRNEILKHFAIGTVAEGYGNGHINDTYLVTMPRYILQRINTSIFRNPDQLMENIENVTAFLRERIKGDGGDFRRGTLTVVPTLEGGRYYKDVLCALPSCQMGESMEDVERFIRRRKNVDYYM